MVTKKNPGNKEGAFPLVTITQTAIMKSPGNE